MIQETAYADKTDAELVALALENQEFLSLLIKRYERKLIAYILRLTSVGFEEAEDILQDVFIKIYKNLNAFDPELKFSSWAYRIAHNEAISHFRKRKSRPEKVSIETQSEVLTKLTDDLDLAKDMDNQYLRRAIDKVLGALDENYREVLVLKFFEEKDYREMSDILEKPMGTIASLVNRAKQKFKEEFKRQEIKI